MMLLHSLAMILALQGDPKPVWSGELTWKFSNVEQEFEQTEIEEISLHRVGGSSFELRRVLKKTLVDGVEVPSNTEIAPHVARVAMGDKRWMLPGSEDAEEKILARLVPIYLPQEFAGGTNSFNEPKTDVLPAITWTLVGKEIQKEGTLYKWSVLQEGNFTVSGSGELFCPKDSRSVSSIKAHYQGVRLPGGSFPCELDVAYKCTVPLRVSKG